MSDLAKLLAELNGKKLDPVTKERLRLELLRGQGPKKDMGVLKTRDVQHDLNADMLDNHHATEFASDPTTDAGDLIVRYGRAAINYALYSAGARATASTTYPGYPPDNTIDDNPATSWSSGSPVYGQWIYIDLSYAVEIDRLVLVQEHSPYAAGTFKIQYSDNPAGTWTDAYEVTTYATSHDVTFTPATARYWRLLATSGSRSDGWAVLVIELYSTPGAFSYLRALHKGAIGTILGTDPSTGLPAWVSTATPAAHKASHENGGSDEISVAGLSGELADAQPAKAHKTTHENGGADEISVAGLSGELADAQTPKAHNQAASTIDVTDSADYFSAAQVEAILAEIGLGWAKLSRANTFTAGQTIAGRADTEQLVVKGNSTQNDDIVQVQNSAGTVLGGFNASGYGGFGTPPAAINGIKVIYLGQNTNLECAANIQAYLPSANALSTYRIFGQYCTVGFARDVSGFANPITELKGQHNITNIANGSAGKITGIWGGSYIIYASGGAGGATNAYGLSAALTGATGWTGTITNGYGIRIDAATVGASGGAITNLYGLYIANQNVGSAVNAAIVTNSGNVIFNEGGDANTDLRAESDTEANMIFLDASADTLALGGTTNGVQISKGGHVTLNGTASVIDALNFDPGSSGGPAATLPDYVTINNVIHREFTSANNQLCGDGEELPHAYKLSSTIYPHVHIFLKSGESAGTTGVTFTLYWELRQSTGTTSGSVTLAATSAQLGTTAGANKLDIYDATGFAGAAEMGAQLALKLARTGGDAGDVVVTTYGVHYEIDSIGSNTATSKT